MKIHEYLSQVLNLLKESQFEDALILLGQLPSEVQNHPRLGELKGMAYYGLADVNKAMATLEAANTMVPLSLVSQCTLASCYIHSGFTMAASAIYTHLSKQALLFRSQLLTANVVQGLIQCQLPDTALALCQAGLGHFPDCPRLREQAKILQRPPTSRFDSPSSGTSSGNPSAAGSLRCAIHDAKQAIRLGNLDHARSILRSIDPATLQCVAILQRLARLFTQLGDDERVANCNTRLREIYYQTQSQYRI